MDYADEGRVLLVDDERLVRFTISAWLKTSGFEVTAVETPEEAIAELKGRPYDVVLTDVMMGTVDGFMFRDIVRGFNARIPFVFLSALVTSPSNNLQEKVSADVRSYYAPKNCRREYLLGRIRQAVGSYRAEREVGVLTAQVNSELRIAARVQHALLPPSACYDGDVFYSCLWCPSNIVSGDLFCWFPLDGKAAAVLFGDIAGHSTPAALGMTAVMAHLRERDTVEAVRTRRPELVCQKIHNYIRANLADVTYMAGTMLIVDYGTMTVRYLNAGGMEPLCFRRCDGSRVELNPERRGGLPMGLTDGTTYAAADVVETAIPEDGIVCLYSDGFVDLTSDVKGENRVPHEILEDVLGELIGGTSGMSDIGSVPYRLTSMLKDMGYLYAQDDRAFCVIGNAMRSNARFVTTVPMDTPDGLNEAVSRVSHWAAGRRYPDNLVARLELLLCEHLENVRKHGLDQDGRRYERVLLEIRPAGEELEVLIWDRGKPYAGDLAEAAVHPDLTLDVQNETLAGSGRGLAIIQKICRRISHENFDGLNKFVFTMAVKS